MAGGGKYSCGHVAPQKPNEVTPAPVFLLPDPDEDFAGT